MIARRTMPARPTAATMHQNNSEKNSGNSQNTVDNMAGNTNDHKQRDNFREKKLLAIRIVEEFLAAASDPRYCGSLVLEMPAKDGRIGRVKHSRTTFEPD